MSRASKQTYLGRVVHPAQYRTTSKKPFLTFDLYVDGVAVDTDKNKTTAKISCSYTVQGDQDVVARILCRIHNPQEEGGSKGLGGEQYKYVDVLVEGTEKLTQAKDSNGNPISRAWYKNLEYCSVSIVDKDVWKLYKKEYYSDNGSEGSSESNTEPTKSSANSNQPNRGPSESTKSRKVYSVGDVIEHNGQSLRFKGGDATRKENWEEVKESNSAPFATSEPETLAPRGQAESSIQSLLEDSTDEEESLFKESRELPI